MKIFISWSGARSRAIAEALNDWLRRVIQAVKPFYSPEIEKGAKWSGEIDTALEGTQFGIICLTPDNLNSTWIHYEAGALSKTKDALIMTFLHGLTPGDVPPPLGKFQHTVAEKGDVLRLLKTINARIGDMGGELLPERMLEENFQLFWPRLEESLKAAEQGTWQTEAANDEDADEVQRDVREILDEILEIVRSQERRFFQIEEQGVAARRDHLQSLPLDKKYWRLEIEMPSVGPGAMGLARKVAAIVEENYEGVKVELVMISGVPIVGVTFSMPLGRHDIRLLLSALEDETGCTFDSWTASL